MSTPKEDACLLILGALDRASIRPLAARALVAGYRSDARESNAGASEQEIREIVAGEIIDRYAALAALSGGVSALTSLVPGFGLAASMLGGGMGDMLVSMKLQIDMTVCLAETFGWDLDAEDARHLAVVLAASGTLEKLGSQAMTQHISRAMLAAAKASPGGALRLLIEPLFRQLGGVYRRRLLRRAIPFGIGALVGGCGDYALTMHVGRRVKRWYTIHQAPEGG